MEEELDPQMLKAKQGLFEIIAGYGGIIPMKDAHDHCEVTFGVGHKRFSDLMEHCVDNDFVSFDDDDRSITLLDKGRNFL
jgi:hypothetical protein